MWLAPIAWGTLVLVQRAVAYRRMRSFYWLSSGCLLTADSLVYGMILRHRVENIRYAEQMVEGRVGEIVDRDAVMSELRCRENDQCSALVCATLLLGAAALFSSVAWIYWMCVMCMVVLVFVQTGPLFPITTEQRIPAGLTVICIAQSQWRDHLQVTWVSDVTYLIVPRQRAPDPVPVRAASPVRIVSRRTTPTPGIPATDERNACIVCTVNQRTHAAMPCGHRCMCGPCAANNITACPFCRVTCVFTRIFDP